jgi:hypothetical protein
MLFEVGGQAMAVRPYVLEAVAGHFEQVREEFLRCVGVGLCRQGEGGAIV